MLIFRTKILHTLLVFIALVSLAYVFAFFESYNEHTMVDAERIEKVISRKKQQTKSILSHVAKNIEENGFDWFVTNQAVEMNNLFHEEGIAVVIYKNWNLRFWPENTVIVPEIFGTGVFEKRFVKLGNSFYMPLVFKLADIDLVGLIYVKSEFDTDSEMVNDKFNNQFYLSSDIRISTNPLQEPRIFDEDNKYLFSLDMRNMSAKKDAFSWLVFLLFAGALIAFFRLFFLVFALKKIDHNYYSHFAFSIVFIAIVRLLMVKYQLPSFLYDFSLFNPEYYASNFFTPSLGDLLLNTIFIIFLIILIRRHLNLNFIIDRQNKFQIRVVFVSFIVFVLFYIFQLNSLLGAFIRDSTIEFQPYRIFNVSGFTFIAFLILLLNLTAFMLFFDWGIRYFKQHLEFSRAAICINLFLAFFLFLSVALSANFTIVSAVYFLIIANLVLYYRWTKQLVFSFVVFFSVVTALYLTFVIEDRFREKQYGRMDLLAINLSVSQDFYTEMRFRDIGKHLPADPYMDTLLTSPRLFIDELQQYVQREYFDDYLSRYEMHVDVCSINDSLFVEDSVVQWQHCRQYYLGLASRVGEPVYKTNYFFMGEKDTRMQYIGIHDVILSNGKLVTLIIHLNSKNINYNPGFTQLLDKHNRLGTNALSQFDYVKYKNGRMVTKYGNCPFSLFSNPYDGAPMGVTRIETDDYYYLVYKPSDGDIIVVSHPTISAFQQLINFSYLFVFIFLLLSLMSVYVLYTRNGFSMSNSIRNRIQFAMISVLLVSVIFIGGGSVYYLAQGYEEKNLQVINEKMHSIITELQTHFSNHRSMKMLDEDYLSFLMQKFTHIYNSDISVFDIDGNLVSTSRPEVYKQNFLSRRMNYSAFTQLKHFQSYKIIQKEHIGELTYYSAYAPLVNDQNNMLGFVNLPFFSNEDLLTEDISSIIVTFINVYLLLILLSVIMAVFISDNVTRPLQILSQKMRQIDLKKHNTRIDLVSDDEVGYLVSEYNHMVDELNRSVELLSRQERETAWRSMARQVAHEIKNPLTPMKLSVQLMLRAWNEKAPDFEQRLTRVSNTLIQQIDTLSNIASEFSTFARMPGEQISKVDINEIIKSVGSLYNEYKNIEIKITVDVKESFIVLADHNRILRMLNNLIKNAAQAIPDNKKGIVKITTSRARDMVLIKVSDNGDGIPEDIRDRLFQPNFTTKTKGMGLGLAMVKNIIEGFGGKIWYDTETGKGSTFFIHLPLIR